MSQSIKIKLEQEFREQLKIAKALIERLPSIRDRQKSLFWVKKAICLNASAAVIKKNRNEFFEFFLNVLRDAVYECSLRNCRGIYLSQKARLKLKEEIRLLGTPCQKTYVLDQVAQKRGSKYITRWSADKRTYVAMQPLIGSGALVYMAVSNNGWTRSKEEPIDIIEEYISNC